MMLQKIKSSALELHNDENGDIPVGTIMVIGLIAIPIVIALIIFRDTMLSWLSDRMNDFTGSETDADGNITPN